MPVERLALIVLAVVAVVVALLRVFGMSAGEIISVLAALGSLCAALRATFVMDETHRIVNGRATELVEKYNRMEAALAQTAKLLAESRGREQVREHDPSSHM